MTKGLDPEASSAGRRSFRVKNGAFWPLLFVKSRGSLCELAGQAGEMEQVNYGSTVSQSQNTVFQGDWRYERGAAGYEQFCFCIGVLFGLCATGGINLQFPEQILCPYGGVWRSAGPPQFVGGSGVGLPAAPKTINGVLSG
jgi:hypothetical protein